MEQLQVHSSVDSNSTTIWHPTYLPPILNTRLLKQLSIFFPFAGAIFMALIQGMLFFPMKFALFTKISKSVRAQLIQHWPSIQRHKTTDIYIYTFNTFSSYFIIKVNQKLKINENKETKKQTRTVHAIKAHLSDSKSRKKEFNSQKLQHKLCCSFRGCATDWDISLSTVFCSGAEDICSHNIFCCRKQRQKNSIPWKSRKNLKIHPWHFQRKKGYVGLNVIQVPYAEACSREQVQNW